MSGEAPPGDAPGPTDEALAARRLRSVLGRWGLIGCAALAAVALVLRPSFSGGALLWFSVNLTALGAALFFIRSRLPRNRRTGGGPLLRELGAGNHATIARGLLIAQLPGYLFFPCPSEWQAWLPALTFTLSLVADFLDGYLARRADQVTGLGEALDIEFDGLGLMAATALAVHYGKFPFLYFLTVGCARYLFLILGWVAQQLGRHVVPIPPSTTRRALAGATMEFGTGALWPIVPSALITLGGAILAVPFLAGFGRDAAIHLGWLDPASESYLALRGALVRLATRFLPPVLRVLIVLLLGPLLIQAATSFPQTVAAVEAAGIGSPAVFAAIVAITGLLGLVSIALGIAGRVGAVGIIIVYGVSLSLVALTARGLAGWGCAMAIYLFGTGPGSLWQPERAIYLLRAGERK